MATIVVTSEEDPMLAVVKFASELAWADAGPEVADAEVGRLLMEAQDCMLMGRWMDLASLMLASADLVAPGVSPKDLECMFTVICNVVTKARSQDETLEMVQLICAKVVQHPGDKPATRLKVLFNLYNLLENPYSRFFVYKKALELAAAGKVAEHIIPSFKKMNIFLNEWNIGNMDQRELFLAIVNILKDNKSLSKEYFSFLNKYLSTFTSSDEDSYSMNDAKEEAVAAIIEFVRAPDLFEFDLLELPAIAQLEEDGKYALVYELLKIFLTQRLDSYLEFEAANSTLLRSYGLVYEDCITKMRLMSLLDLSSHWSGEIPYSAIKDTLRIDDDEVEYWIVKAIVSKLLDCRVDQVNQMVIVSRHSERTFGMSQWQSLRAKLGIWRGNVARAVNTIQASKVTEDGTQAMQGLMIR